ncbi:AraC family transcriptional regulator [Cyclobacterium sp. GBPx2]|uniref:AraC family transcriptional regulator n=1 Tax=Cyclobacterium plantarum TaxID=2716263 RepID=A0ABX0H4P7_9BACT|nr:AraC family transcriptional regulator [Cyclobacterium plantarum]
MLRLYKLYYGQTPKQYLIEKRLEAAKQSLGKGLSITDTCYEIGFESPSSFSTLFKARFGLSPKEYQKKATFTKSNHS